MEISASVHIWCWMTDLGLADFKMFVFQITVSSQTAENGSELNQESSESTT